MKRPQVLVTTQEQRSRSCRLSGCRERPARDADGIHRGACEGAVWVQRDGGLRGMLLGLEEGVGTPGICVGGPQAAPPSEGSRAAVGAGPPAAGCTLPRSLNRVPRPHTDLMHTHLRRLTHTLTRTCTRSHTQPYPQLPRPLLSLNLGSLALCCGWPCPCWPLGARALGGRCTEGPWQIVTEWLRRGSGRAGWAKRQGWRRRGRPRFREARARPGASSSCLGRWARGQHTSYPPSFQELGPASFSESCG